MGNREIDIELEQAAEIAALKIAPVFKANGWKWVNLDEGFKGRVPDAEEIERHIMEKMNQLRDKVGEGEISSGRIVVRKQESDLGDYDYEVLLELSSVFNVPDEADDEEEDDQPLTFVGALNRKIAMDSHADHRFIPCSICREPNPEHCSLCGEKRH